MNESRILYARKDRRLFVKMIGSVRHTVSPGFNAVLDEAFREGDTDVFIIDLSEARYVDSTNLGLLAKIARYTSERHAAQPIIVSDQADIRAVLVSMGFDMLFTIVSECRESYTDVREAPAVAANQDEKAQLVLDAHKALMEMNTKNRHMFRDAVAVFEKAVAAHRQRH